METKLEREFDEWSKQESYTGWGKYWCLYCQKKTMQWVCMIRDDARSMRGHWCTACECFDGDSTEERFARPPD